MSSRDLHVPRATAIHGRTYNSDGSIMKTYTYSTPGTEGYLFSVGHPCVKGRYEEGGPFDLNRTILSVLPSKELTLRYYFQGSNQPYGVYYKGGFLALRPSPNSEEWLNGLSPESVGAKCWDQARPAKPQFDAALNLLELKDLPRTLRHATKSLRDLVRTVWTKRNKAKIRAGKAMSRTAEWHLAVEFGWLPLLSSIRDFQKAQAREQRVVDQLIRDNGRPVRRRGEIKSFTVDTDTVTVTNDGNRNGIQPILISPMYHTEGTRTLRNRVTQKVWFSGRFRYFLPDGPRTVEWKKEVVRRLYGMRVTPSLVYNLMPWSWLVDYFTTLGDVMDNLSQGVEDRLIADYFYVMTMREQHISTTNEFVVGGSYGNPQTAVKTTAFSHIVRKQRAVGSPFGLGRSVSDLTPKQLGIMAALGLSRL